MTTTPEGALAELERILDDEESALRAMNAARVREVASEKEVWLARLVDSGAFEDVACIPALRRFSQRLRKNALLLTYARDFTRDALTALGLTTEDAGYGSGRRVAVAPGRTLSKTG